jgi:hypothetical protein
MLTLRTPLQLALLSFSGWLNRVHGEWLITQQLAYGHRPEQRLVSGRFWKRVIRKDSTHHVLVDLPAERARNLLRYARATQARIEALDLENCSYQFL